ncbi:MAG: hypothetical protein K2K14_06925 [Ruminococcus sp.]|nr:hypothetical protein [Ruminococcus sp.]
MFLINEIVSFLAVNLILTQALGTSTFFIAADSRKKLICTSVVITFFTSLGSVMTYFADRLLPEKFSDLKLLFYTLSVGILYVLFLYILQLTGTENFSEYKKYIHISAFNCAVMGTLLTVDEKADTLTEYLFYGIESGLGFITASLILTSAYRKLSSAKVPESFRGFPAMLVYLGIISMAVYTLK